MLTRVWNCKDSVFRVGNSRAEQDSIHRGGTFEQPYSVLNSQKPWFRGCGERD